MACEIAWHVTATCEVLRKLENAATGTLLPCVPETEVCDCRVFITNGYEN